jgi:two-component system, cell cycle sensor histidine kinase and response regulator CckA
MAPRSLSFDAAAALRAALSAESAERALQGALAQLAELGLTAHTAPDQPAWLTAEYGGRRLSLDGPAEALDDGTRELLSALLEQALRRAVEQEQHRKVSERLEMLSAASFEGLMIHVDGVIIDANQRLAELLGCELSEVLGASTLRVCVAEEDQPDVMRRMAERVEGEYVITGIRRDGSRFRAELSSKQGRLGERPVRVVAVRDVTERERTATLLRESEGRLRNLTQQAFDAIVFSRDGVIVDVGGRFQELLGFERWQLVGRPLTSFVDPSCLPLARQVVAEQRTGAYELTVIDAQGLPVPVEVVAVHTTLDGAPVRLAALRDLREARRLAGERRALQQQVERSQRLESLGVLAGGIAHDFNNLLMGVLGSAEFLERRLEDPALREYARTIRTAGEGAAALTRQMLAYAGQRDLERREPVDLAALSVELRTLLGAALSRSAHVEFSLVPDSVVLGDRTTLMQVLMNLLTNASDALPDGAGHIEVRTSRLREPGPRWDRSFGASVRPGDWVLLEVQDTGVGMTPATLERIFEPFFSTKATGHGLGLAACLGIVAAHGGALLVESEPGKGSCFAVLLPASDTATPSPQPSLAAAPPAG